MRRMSDLSPDFCSDLSDILEKYWRGYYSDALAECKRSLAAHGDTFPAWEVAFIKAVREYLDTWDQDHAYLMIVTAASRLDSALTQQEPVVRFYHHMLCSWFCSQERANLARLRDAYSHAELGVTLLTDINSEVWEKHAASLEHYPFFPRQWCIFWFRALTRHALFETNKAVGDFRRAHRVLIRRSEEAFHKAQNERGVVESADNLEKDRSVSRLKRIRDYCAANEPLAGRFYSDMAMFLFDSGDKRTAKRALELAVGQYTEAKFDSDGAAGPQPGSWSFGIDPCNPYVWSNLGFVLYSFKTEEEVFYSPALDALTMAYELATRTRNPSESDCRVSGRIFYFLGAFAYRWQNRQVDPYEAGAEAELEAKIEALPARWRSIFRTKKGVHNILGLAFNAYYCKAKDLSRALPAFIICCDPLAALGNDDPLAKATNNLLWEYSYGAPDFLFSHTMYQRLTDQYLLRGRIS